MKKSALMFLSLLALAACVPPPSQTPPETKIETPAASAPGALPKMNLDVNSENGVELSIHITGGKKLAWVITSSKAGDPATLNIIASPDPEVVHGPPPITTFTGGEMAIRGSAPSALGFQQGLQCPGPPASLGDTVTPDGCLALCRKQPEASACWWIDGTGGQNTPRECRYCLNSPPEKTGQGNDWVMPLSKEDVVTPPNPDLHIGSDPAVLGFVEFSRCPEGENVSLGDSGSPDVCLALCREHDSNAACWWQDGISSTRRECHICKTPNAQINASIFDWFLPAAQPPVPRIMESVPTSPASEPAALGFQQYFKCTGQAVPIGDTGTPNACLASCRALPNVMGCWWLDGTGGFGRECRVCTDKAPEKDSFANDWGLSLTTRKLTTPVLPPEPLSPQTQSEEESGPEAEPETVPEEPESKIRPGALDWNEKI
ncbi:MAG: hypothetical protein AB7H77_05050 [Bdellovibrionales bacterium]